MKLLKQHFLSENPTEPEIEYHISTLSCVVLTAILQHMKSCQQMEKVYVVYDGVEYSQIQLEPRQGLCSVVINNIYRAYNHKSESFLDFLTDEVQKALDIHFQTWVEYIEAQKQNPFEVCIHAPVPATAKYKKENKLTHDNSCWAIQQYRKTENKYDGEYGALRLKLAAHLIECFKKQAAKAKELWDAQSIV